MFYYRYYWTGSAAATHTQQSSKQRLTGEPTHKHINSPCLSTRYYPRFQSVQLFVQNYQPWTAFYITTHCSRTWVEWKTHSLSTNAGAALARSSSLVPTTFGTLICARWTSKTCLIIGLVRWRTQTRSLFDCTTIISIVTARGAECWSKQKKYQKFFDNVAGNGRCKDHSYEWQ